MQPITVILCNFKEVDQVVEFFRLLELCVINSMCLFFEKNPEFARCPEMLIHELVQPVFHKQNYNESPANMACLYQPKKRSRIMGKMTFALEAGIMQQRSTLEGSTVCVDTK